MVTYFGALETGRHCLEQSGIADAANDAWLLMEYVTGMTRGQYFLKMHGEMPEPEYQKYRQLISIRKAHTPLQHITGVQEFMGFPFLVNEHVLIPRQDTEVLVETAVEAIKNMPKADAAAEKPEVLDLCCGSGCIGISVARLADCRVYLSDISPEALKTAGENAAALGVKAALIQSDLFTELKDMRFDFILSNPPYIKTEEIDGLMPEVRDHEPVLALDGKSDGLHFYRIITEKAADFLKPGGWLMVEIGCEQAEDVAALMQMHGMTQIQVKKDYAGLNRVVLGSLEQR